MSKLATAFLNNPTPSTDRGMLLYNPSDGQRERLTIAEFFARFGIGVTAGSTTVTLTTLIVTGNQTIGGTLGVTGDLTAGVASFTGFVSAPTVPLLGEHLVNKTYADAEIASAVANYLPLAGGTLTGALVGTKATFNQASGIPLTVNRTTDFGELIEFKQAGSAIFEIRSSNAVALSSDVILRTTAGGTGSLIFQTNGANPALTLDASQNAIFTGSITGTSGDFSGAVAITGAGRAIANMTITNTSGSNAWRMVVGATGVNNTQFVIKDETNTVDVLTLSPTTGNATFSGSITGTTQSLVAGNNVALTLDRTGNGSLIHFKNETATIGRLETYATGVRLHGDLGMTLRLGSNGVQGVLTLETTGNATFTGNVDITKTSGIPQLLLETSDIAQYSNLELKGSGTNALRLRQYSTSGTGTTFGVSNTSNAILFNTAGRLSMGTIAASSFVLGTNNLNRLEINGTGVSTFSGAVVVTNSLTTLARAGNAVTVQRLLDTAGNIMTFSFGVSPLAYGNMHANVGFLTLRASTGNALRLGTNGGTTDFILHTSGDATFSGAVNTGVLTVNGGGTNIVASFISTDQFAILELSDNTTSSPEILRRTGNVTTLYDGNGSAIITSSGTGDATFSGTINANQVIEGLHTSAFILSHGGTSKNIFLRPNGSGSTSGQIDLNTTNTIFNKPVALTTGNAIISNTVDANALTLNGGSTGTTGGTVLLRGSTNANYSANAIELRTGGTKRLGFDSTGDATFSGAVTGQNNFITQNKTATEFCRYSFETDQVVNTQFIIAYGSTHASQAGELALKVTSAGTDMTFYTNSVKRLTIAKAGNATFTSTVTATDFILSSDARLKSNIQPIGGDFFKYEMGGRTRYGTTAQQIEKAHPELVHENAEGMKSVSYIDLLVMKIAELENRLNKIEA